ncbi:MAG TPA: hypothetical protein PLV45_08815, partial [bacterium]|nr:hypothetical protein [bacterium]
MARVFKQVRGILTAPRRMFRELTLTNPAPLAAAVVCLTLGSLWLSLWASHSAVYADNVKAYAALAVVYSLTFLCGIALFSAVWHL